jgi:four helix bundle protein
MKDEGFAPRDLRQRTREFGVRIMRLGDSLPKTRSANVIANQIIRSGTSVGAHYREAARSRSNAEVISKLEGALQELDETAYWLELLIGGKIISEKKLALLKQETNELIAILVTCVKKVKAKSRR